MIGDCRKEEVESALVAASVVACVADLFLIFTLLAFHGGDLESAKDLLHITVGLMSGIPFGAFWFFGKIRREEKKEKDLKA